MLIGFTLLCMAIVAYAFMSEGLFTACVQLINVLIAGLISFNYFEPTADFLDSLMAGTFMVDYLDALSMVGLFCLVLGILRVATYNFAPTQVDYHALVQTIGGALVGLITGYLVAGFLVCVLQTLPWHEEFMGFSPRPAPDSSTRSYLPPDRVWLAMMRRVGGYGFSNDEERSLEPFDTDNRSPFRFTDNYIARFITFDKYGTFESRYARYRRYNDKRDPLPYNGELTKQLHKVQGQAKK